MSSFPDYDFSPYLEALGRNWYLEDELLQRILGRLAPEAARASEGLLVDFGARAAGVYRELADAIERPEKLPSISRKDAYDRRQPRVLPTVRSACYPTGTRAPAAARRPGALRSSSCWHEQGGGTLCSIACTVGDPRAPGAGRTRAFSGAAAPTEPTTGCGAQFVTESGRI
jgi:hypothetical protein